MCAIPPELMWWLSFGGGRVAPPWSKNAEAGHRWRIDTPYGTLTGDDRAQMDETAATLCASGLAVRVVPNYPPWEGTDAERRRVQTVPDTGDKRVADANPEDAHERPVQEPGDGSLRQPTGAPSAGD